MSAAIVILAVLIILVESSNVTDCEKLIWSDANDGCNSCGNNVNGSIECDDRFVYIRSCYCLYFDQTLNESILGNCIITCSITKETYPINRYSVENATLLNDIVCNIPFNSNREGRFCGRCREGYGLAAYSYHYTTCIPCSDYGYKNWIKYFTIALLPLTVFYFLVVILRINATSSRLTGIVFVVQCVVLTPLLTVLDDVYAAGKSGSFVQHTKYVTSFLGIFNLDFLRDIYPYFCLHPHMNILHVFSLDYIIALYPFTLILLTYVLITMYDNNYRLIVAAWKPFHWCTKNYRRKLSIKTSLVETFCTFILLSNIKILTISYSILIPTRTYDSSGHQAKQRFLYYDATIEYFSREHLPFAVLALSVSFVFVFLPFLLLVLYPCRCFQKCLNHFGWRCQALHVFMDAFQGSYKTEPYDLRYFSAYYQFFRFMLILLAIISMSRFYIPLSAILLTVAALVFFLFQPYKNNNHNIIDIVSMILAALFYMLFTADMFSLHIDPYWLVLARPSFLGFAVVLFLYMIAVFIPNWFYLYVNRKLRLVFFWIKNYRKNDTSKPFEGIDRRDYPPLLQDKHQH